MISKNNEQLMICTVIDIETSPFILLYFISEVDEHEQVNLVHHALNEDSYR